MTRTIDTGISVPNSITVLGGSIGVMCGEEGGTTRIKSYDLQTGAELCCVDLSEDAFGLAEVKLGEKFRVATAQGKQGIWFLLFPDRENTENFVVTQGKFLRHRENFFDCIY